MESIFDWSVILSIVGVLVVLTNIIVQVLKKLTWDRLPTNILAVIVAMGLTLAAFFAWSQVKGLAVVWYMVVAAVVVGFMVAYAAMFGFDKLKEAIMQFEKKKVYPPPGGKCPCFARKGPHKGCQGREG